MRPRASLAQMPRSRLAVITVGVALIAGPGPAAADTVTFSYTGAEQVFVVPAGVSRVEVTVIGAKGGRAGSPFAGLAVGRGALVTGSLAVSPGQALYVEVGGAGGTSAGGFNGGGPGGPNPGEGAADAGGGGGGSDVRTASRTTIATLATRRIIAGGGGGAGGGNDARGGDAEAAGGGNDPGGGASQTAGGAAGDYLATAGTLGSGGSGGSYPTGSAGGGGGGGRYGGGGGGASGGTAEGGGGGGGSSLVPAGGSKSLAPLIIPAGAQIAFTGASGAGGGGGAGAGAGGGADLIPPVVSRFVITPVSFSAANFGPSAARVGTRLLYRVSEAATTTFTVQRARPGVRRGRACVRRRRSMRGRSCTRYVAVRGSFRHRAEAGLNTLLFSGRVRGRRLALGRYRLTATARDAAGNRSRPIRRAFRIVRR
jgi:Glycine rich protein